MGAMKWLSAANLRDRTRGAGIRPITDAGDADRDAFRQKPLAPSAPDPPPARIPTEKPWNDLAHFEKPSPQKDQGHPTMRFRLPCSRYETPGHARILVLMIAGLWVL